MGVNSTLVIAEGCRPPSAIVRTLVHDSLGRLDDFAREYRGYVGKVMDYVCGDFSTRFSRRARTSGVNEDEEELYCGTSG
jgi:hypothetical protein